MHLGTASGKPIMRAGKLLHGPAGIVARTLNPAPRPCETQGANRVQG